VPSNRPAATTNIAIAMSATAQSRAMIRWSLFMIASLELGLQQGIDCLLLLAPYYEDQVSVLIYAR
jgi:hypothetical protein